jgi:hypothetical protein
MALAAPLTLLACASTSGADRSSSGKLTSGYEVRDAVESDDTDGLQVRLDHGVISQEAAQEAVMRRWKDLTGCYAQAGTAMGFAEGPVTLRFLVDPAGATTDVRVIKTRLGNFEVERCLITVGRGIRFPRPSGNAEATVDYPLEFRSTGEIPVVDLIAEDLTDHLPGLFARLGSECEQLGAEEVQATMYIDAAGTVRSVGLAALTAVDEQKASCVSAAIRRWNVRTGAVQGGLGRVTVAVRSGDLVAREPSSEVRRYSRASATARARPRRGRAPR